jgi:phenylpropionate dioxygenase-like ring-hydroxylating dioxygenase large terminal subunit
MLKKEDNELLTQTGPGTACGDLLRRYWQPVALSEEIPPGGSPVPVRILGEDLVLFRDDEGRPGLLDRHCSHRGTDLSYGRVEDGGLRCLYHGWLYDIKGKCLEQPGEPSDSRTHIGICHKAYPCIEVAGAVFAHMNPGNPPLFPEYQIFTVPDEYRYSPTKTLHNCNYLQGNEGNIDPVHLSFLHRFLDATSPTDITRTTSSRYFMANDLRPIIDVEPTDFGLRIYAVRKAEPQHICVRITNFIMPNLCAIPTVAAQDGYQIDWHVPIDDRHHWKYTFIFRKSAPLTEKTKARGDLTEGYRPVRNAENRYLQSREEMKKETFSGMGRNFLLHDVFATESMGPIQDRTKEHLVSSDKAVVMARLLLLKAVRDIQEGGDPLHVIRDQKTNHFPHLVVRSEILPENADWKTYWREAQ